MSACHGFVVDAVLAPDGKNLQVAVRLLAAFKSFSAPELARRAFAEAALKGVAATWASLFMAQIYQSAFWGELGRYRFQQLLEAAAKVKWRNFHLRGTALSISVHRDRALRGSIFI